MTDDSHATSADSVTVCSAPGLRTVVSVALSSAVSARPRSMRLPMSIIVQPTSCTIDSAATPGQRQHPGQGLAVRRHQERLALGVRFGQ